MNGNIVFKMSKSQLDCDGFQTVTSKRFSKNKPTKIPRKDFSIQEANVEIDSEKAKRRIHCAVEDIKGSEYLENVFKSVSSVLETREVVEIVCFGLGHIGECNISRHQLALLLCLKDYLKPVKVLVHDPVFYKVECQILTELCVEVIQENKEGSYIISDKASTLVYLPHCPKQLTNNFLWCNWSINIHNCILICNSFTSLIENNPSRIISESVPYIGKIFPHCTEVSLKNNFKYTDIFNDTSLHYFPKKILEGLEDQFWIKGDKPEYTDSEEFITSLMVKKLNI